MSVVPLQSLQCSLQNLHNAFKRFYKGLGCYPNFKKKRDGQAFRIAQPNTMRISDGKLYIPKLKSGIEVVVSKPIIGRVCFATVTKSKSGKYFVTITVRQNEYERFERTGRSVGIDLGIKDLVITSDGVKYGRKKQQIKNEKRKLKHNQRRLSKKVKGSRRYEKQILKCNRNYERMTNIKVDYIHKISTDLVRNYDVINVEDLNIKGMLKNHRLAEVIMECNWGAFVSMLEYKCLWHGKELVKVDRFYPSSQLCSECGYRNPKVKNLNIREWVCPICGQTHDRDLNAAINILKYTSARNVDYSRGGVMKPNERPESVSGCSDTCEAMSGNGRQAQNT